MVEDSENPVMGHCVYKCAYVLLQKLMRALTNEDSYKRGLLQKRVLTGVFDVRLPEEEDRRLVWK